MTEWRPYPEFPEHYAVSDDGQVKRLDRDHILKQKPAGIKGQYRKVILCIYGKIYVMVR